MIKTTKRTSMITVRLLLSALMGLFVLVCFAQPAAPQVNIEIMVTDNVDHVKISWEPVEGAESYNIYASPVVNPEDWGDPIATVGDSVFTYTTEDSVDDLGRAYFFYVTAYAEIVIPDWLVLVDGDLFNGDVTIDPFYIGKYQVTRAEFRDLMGDDWEFTHPNPGDQPEPTDDNYPANWVSWFDAVEYCNRRSIREGLEPVYAYNGRSDPDLWYIDFPGWNEDRNNHINVSCNWEADGYRLPTEVEWHHAANAGIYDADSEWPFGGPFEFAGSNDVHEVAWFFNNAGFRTHPVGTKLPNGLGIYDMSGNLNDWCWDMHGDAYPSGDDNPRGAEIGQYRVVRGGNWGGSAQWSRVSLRQSLHPERRISGYGFRVVRNAPPPEERMVLVDGDLYNGVVDIDPFLISKYQVTQEEYEAVMGVNPSHFADEDGVPNFENLPVEMVSWYDVIEYCNRLSISEGLEPVYSYLESGTDPDDWYERHPGWNENNANHTNVSADWEVNGYRLPTEAEWHHAANAATHPAPYTYSGSNDIDEVGWYSGNSDIGDGQGLRTHPVGAKLPNGLGIYDMTGNVFEWCWDRYQDAWGSNSRVTRGGSWDFGANFATLAYRSTRFNATVKVNRVGFRVVRNAQ